MQYDVTWRSDTYMHKHLLYLLDRDISSIILIDKGSHVLESYIKELIYGLHDKGCCMDINLE
jgi:hypothetical protein